MNNAEGMNKDKLIDDARIDFIVSRSSLRQITKHSDELYKLCPKEEGTMKAAWHGHEVAKHVNLLSLKLYKTETQLVSLCDTIERQQKEIEGLLKLTELIDEHPEDYDGPCFCKECQLHASDDEGTTP